MSSENAPRLTPLEEQLALEIQELLKHKNITGAEEKINTLLSITQNKILKEQYSRILVKVKGIKQPSAPKSETEEDKFRVKVEKSKVKFSDVKGMEKLKKSLIREVTLMIRSRDDFIRHKLKPSGILLYGPPRSREDILPGSACGGI